MNIVEQIYLLKPHQVKQLLEDLCLIGIAYEVGSDYRAVARRLSIRYVGRRRKIYDFIIQCNEFEKITESLLETQPLLATQPNPLRGH